MRGKLPGGNTGVESSGRESSDHHLISASLLVRKLYVSVLRNRLAESWFQKVGDIDLEKFSKLVGKV